MNSVFVCRCGGTIEIEVAYDEYFEAECFDCGLYADHASLFKLKQELRKRGCTPIDEYDELEENI